MKLSNVKRLLREDMPDAPNGEWLDILVRTMNDANEQEVQALQNALTFGDNLNAAFGVYRLTHGVSSTIPVPDGLKGRPVWVDSVRSIAVSGSTRQPVAYIDWEHVDNDDPKAKNQVKVTPYFNRTVSGAVGAYSESVIATGSAVTLTTAQWNDVTSLSLTAGDYDVSILPVFTNGTGVTGTAVAAFVGTVSGNNSTGRSIGNNDWSSPTVPTANSDVTGALTVRLVPTSTTTYYLKVVGLFTAGTIKAAGRISARRQIDAYSDSAPVANVVLFFSAG